MDATTLNKCLRPIFNVTQYEILRNWGHNLVQLIFSTTNHFNSYKKYVKSWILMNTTNLIKSHYLKNAVTKICLGEIFIGDILIGPFLSKFCRLDVCSKLMRIELSNRECTFLRLLSSFRIPTNTIIVH